MNAVTEPLPGRPRTAARLLAAQVGHELAGVPILRGLPQAGLHSIGPFVFLDHVLPNCFNARQPAHPHAGIEVLTYLLEGQVRHRDSLGHDATVSAGGLQFMSAGRGLLHEESPATAGGRLQAIQLWTRLPRATQQGAPYYRQISPAEVPLLHLPQGDLRLLGGDWSGLPGQASTPLRGPLPIARPHRLAHLSLRAGQQLSLPLPEHEQLGLYLIDGEAALTPSCGTLTRHSLVLLSAGNQLQLENRSKRTAEILLLGGAAIDEPLHFGGPFVFDSAQQVEQAYHHYRWGGMGRLGGVPF